jgi:hypothetical protein
MTINFNAMANLYTIVVFNATINFDVANYLNALVVYKPILALYIIIVE